MNFNKTQLFVSILFLISQIATDRSNSYKKINEFNNYQLDNSFVLNSFNFSSISKLQCLSICTKTSLCFYILLHKDKCVICKKNSSLFMNYKPGGEITIYKKEFQKTKGLINYWSFNTNVNDSIGNAHLYDGVNANLTNDRFGIPKSALSLINGYYKLPPGVYINGTEFSITGWVKVRNFLAYSRLIDLGNGEGLDNIVFSLSESTSAKPLIHFQSGTNSIRDFSQTSLNLNQWQHIACVFSFPNYFIYIDGVETTIPGSKTQYTSFGLPYVNRTSNYIGKSNWVGNMNANADFDDIKLFNRALSQKEIQFEMNNNY